MGSILVTGSSSGIGKACALHLDHLGHRVFAGVRTEAAASALSAGASSRLEPVTLDVTDEDQVAEVADRVKAEVGAAGLDGVVNNAGVAAGGPLEFLELDDWRHQLEVNVVGQVAVTKAMLPVLRPARGRVVFIGSVSGRLSTPLMGPYGASKFAVEAIAMSLSEELRPWGMKVSVVEPGAVATEIWGKGRTRADELYARFPPEAHDLYEEQFADIRRMIDSQEAAGIDPAKVAAAVEHALFAARPKPRYQVGVDAKAGAVMSRFLPDRAIGPVLRRLGP